MKNEGGPFRPNNGEIDPPPHAVNDNVDKVVRLLLEKLRLADITNTTTAVSSDEARLLLALFDETIKKMHAT